MIQGKNLPSNNLCGRSRVVCKRLFGFLNVTIFPKIKFYLHFVGFTRPGRCKSVTNSLAVRKFLKEMLRSSESRDLMKKIH